jgi:hypothetical protein
MKKKVRSGGADASRSGSFLFFRSGGYSVLLGLGHVLKGAGSVRGHARGSNEKGRGGGPRPARALMREERSHFFWSAPTIHSGPHSAGV